MILFYSACPLRSVPDLLFVRIISYPHKIFRLFLRLITPCSIWPLKSRALSITPLLVPLVHSLIVSLLRYSRQRLPCRSALECAPGVSAAEQCHFTLHSIPFSPCHAAQQHFVYRATAALWMDGKMSWNANGWLMLLRQGSPCQSNNIYSASFVKVMKTKTKLAKNRGEH